MCSCSLLSFAATHFHLGGRFPTADKNFNVTFEEIGLLCFFRSLEAMVFPRDFCDDFKVPVQKCQGERKEHV